jgi:single-stranded DNA-binding protein
MNINKVHLHPPLAKGWLVAVDGRREFGQWETDGGEKRHDYTAVGNVEFLTPHPPRRAAGRAGRRGGPESVPPQAGAILFGAADSARALDAANPEPPRPKWSDPSLAITAGIFARHRMRGSCDSCT